ncbi:response regulator, partial [Falsiroseomonas sp. CW058]|uniref:response regulator n=1 Tax=Falsiroseomonas sp. CW058 TaxID=3388664 RepID=UPI003D3126CE
GAARWATGRLPPQPCTADLALALGIAGLRAPEAAGTAPAPPTAAAGLRVLVADDNAVNRRVAARILENAGHSVVLVANGSEALDALEAAEEEGAQPFDAALLDVNMPGLDGVEAAKLYRMGALGQARRLPLLALTADATPEAAARCLAAGMDRCITKPVEPAALLAALAEAAASAAPRAAPPAPAPAARPGHMAAALDAEVLDRLLALGGASFLAGLAEDFLADGEGLLDRLAAAQAAQDRTAFAAEAHALGSCAANLGALPLQALCRAAQARGGAGWVAASAGDVAAIRQEYARLRQALEPHRAVAAPAG